MTVTAEVRECTAGEAATWRERYTAGYQYGRRDTVAGMVRGDVVLPAIPAELPSETGAAYVARLVDVAFRIGYTRAYLWYGRRP